MATTKQRRPRIDPETAAVIDQIRGRMPFEAFIQDAVGMYLELFFVDRLRRSWKPGDDVTKKWKVRPAKDHEILDSLLSSDFFEYDGERFEKAVQDTLATWRAHMDEFAEEDARDAEEEDDD